ncbi:MAG: hypothetical protein WBH03_06370, partial [Cyclobacteriaceae bacterium]
MKIIDTFEVVGESLYAVQFNDEDKDELRLLFERWNDPEYLFTFFEEHEADLKGPFWRGISIEQAILKTRKDAQKLEKKLLRVARKGRYGAGQVLS